MTGRLRLGVVGVSRVLWQRVVPALSGTTIDISAIASRTMGTAAAAAERLGCRAVSHDELFDDGEVDAVYVSTPPRQHAEFALRAIEAGKHVLVEKPMATAALDVRGLHDAGERQRRVVVEALMFVHHPVFSRIRHLVSSGAIGEVRHIDAAFGIPMPRAGDHRLDASAGGGALCDAAVYPLNFAIRLHDGEPMAGVVSSWQDVGGVDTGGHIALTWPGSTASLTFGFGVSYRNRARIWGTGGELELDRPFSKPDGFAPSIQVASGEHATTVEVVATDQFQAMLQDFAATIERCEQGAVPGGVDGQTLRTATLLASIADGAPTTPSGTILSYSPTTQRRSRCDE